MMHNTSANSEFLVTAAAALTPHSTYSYCTSLPVQATQQTPLRARATPTTCFKLYSLEHLTHLNIVNYDARQFYVLSITEMGLLMTAFLSNQRIQSHLHWEDDRQHPTLKFCNILPEGAGPGLPLHQQYLAQKYPTRRTTYIDWFCFQIKYILCNLKIIHNLWLLNGCPIYLFCIGSKMFHNFPVKIVNS